MGKREEDNMAGKGPTKFGRAMFEKKKNTFAKEKMTSDDAYRMGAKKGGKILKKVKPSQKGLKKLPKKVRNKMGYMKNGGRAK